MASSSSSSSSLPSSSATSSPNDSSPWNFTASTNTTTTTTTPAARPPFNIQDIFVAIMKTYPDYQASQRLGLYGCSVQVAVGTLTNLLTMAVMTRRALFSSTTCFYFTFLAVADLFVLYFGCLRRLLTIANNQMDIYIQSTASCRIMNFLGYFSYDMSSWILTIMTIDRFIAVCFPLKSASVCTRQNACLALTGIAILCSAKNCHFFISFEQTDKDGCLGMDAFDEFLDEVWPWIDATFYSFLPFSLLFIFNVLIICYHRQTLKQQRFLHAITSLSEETPGPRINQRLTIMLLVVSFTFMVMTAPKVILLCIRHEYFPFNTPEGKIDFEMIARYTLVSAVFNFLMWTNHTINFFLYCLSGTRFRQEFLRMLSQWMLCFRCKHRTRVSAANLCGVAKHGKNSREELASHRRGSNTSVLSDEVEPAPAQLPQETEDARSRVTRWATVNFGQQTSTK